MPWKSSKSPPPSSDAGAASPMGTAMQTCPLKDPGAASSAHDNVVNVEFDPDKSAYDIRCNKIVHVQFNRRIADGVVIRPSESSPTFAFKDALCTAHGWTVDCMQTEMTPDYQQGGGAGYGDNGRRNGGSSTKATLFDAPNSPTIAKNGGFYNPATNPGGVRRYEIEFLAFAYCMDGPDCGKWYEGVNWTYTKTWEDAAAGRKGVTAVKQSCVTRPDAEQIEAFDLFNRDRGFTPCRP